MRQREIRGSGTRSLEVTKALGAQGILRSIEAPRALAEFSDWVNHFFLPRIFSNEIEGF